MLFVFQDWSYNLSGEGVALRGKIWSPTECHNPKGCEISLHIWCISRGSGGQQRRRARESLADLTVQVQPCSTLVLLSSWVSEVHHTCKTHQEYQVGKCIPLSQSLKTEMNHIYDDCVRFFCKALQLKIHAGLSDGSREIWSWLSLRIRVTSQTETVA